MTQSANGENTEKRLRYQNDFEGRARNKRIGNLNMKARLIHPRLSLTLSRQLVEAVDDLDLRFRLTAKRCQLVEHQFGVASERLGLKYRRDSEKKCES